MKRTLILAFLAISTSFPAFSTRHTIVQDGLIFTPDQLSVSIGDTIQWVWQNGDHTTTSKGIPSGAAAWDSPLTASVPVFEYVVLVPGEYEYMCTPHESMGMTGKFETTSLGMSEDVYWSGLSICCSRGNAMLYADVKASEDFLMTVYDSGGRKHFTETVMLSAGSNALPLRMQALMPGIYILTLENRFRKPASVKFAVF